MTQLLIRDARPDDFVSIVALNEVEVQQTSAMDESRLQLLSSMACYLKVAVVDDTVAAFLLAFRDHAAYENTNYEWFAARFPTFVYVDRIVVSSAFFGLKIGSLLYQDLFAFARTQGISAITCEYNIQPPNPASKAFHDKFGFKQLGSQWVANGTKEVSLQAAEI